MPNLKTFEILQSSKKNKLRLVVVGLVACGGLFLTPTFSSAKTLTFKDQTWEVNPQTGQSYSNFGVRNEQIDLKKLSKTVLLDDKQLATDVLLDEQTTALLNDVVSKVNQPAKDAKLIIDGKFAKEFEPGQNGQGVDIFTLRQTLMTGSDKIDLPVIYSSPSNKLSQTNNLGINELIAVGETDFHGSSQSRVTNIKVGSGKFNGLLIDKGEIFSFNKYLGDVDGEHGFLPELVIKKTGVVAEFGGGICQVSSTVFRGAMNAGFPINERRNHSFAVKYYAPQGTDATIYPGVQDLKFTNNYPSAVLVRTRMEGTKLYFEFYGTKDGRQVAFDGPTQYDIQANGALKATWTRHVTLNGEVTHQTFNSNYQPPALFQKTEQSTTPNPQSPPPPVTPPTPPTT